MTRTQTKLSDLINPEVMGDMISATLPKKIVVTPFAVIDDTLVGREGDTITVPQYAYIGDAVDVAEGVECDTTKLTATKTTVKVKKAMKAVELTDEAVLSGYGDPVGQTNLQLSKALASKMDQDAMDALTGSSVQLKYDAGAIISYAGIVNAVDKFEEELNTEKVMFVHPKQVTQLRLDPNFISADKYNNNVIMTGEIGMIANCRIVPSKRVPLATSKYSCPIVKITLDEETETEVPALTIYMKRDVNVETERETLKRLTIVSADEIYAVALSNTSKVVLASFAETGTPALQTLNVDASSVTVNADSATVNEAGAGA